LATGLNPTLRAVLDPFIEFYRPLPPLAYLPLVIIWCGIGETSKILLAAPTAAGSRGRSRSSARRTPEPPPASATPSPAASPATAGASW
ncbi:hypothetical protein ACQKLZ_25020, partial [Methylobacterium tarhaniae]